VLKSVNKVDSGLLTEHQEKSKKERNTIFSAMHFLIPKAFTISRLQWPHSWVACFPPAKSGAVMAKSNEVAKTPADRHTERQWRHFSKLLGVQPPDPSLSSLPSLLPSPLSPSRPFPPFRSRTPEIQLGGLGKRCKLPQRGLGRSPSRNRIWCISD